MWIILLILVTLSLGGYIGYRIGIYYVGQQNNTLLNQLQLQERFSLEWAQAASGSNQLYQNVAQQQTANLSTTMGTIIQLLHTVQHQPQSSSISPTDQQRIQNIISQAQTLIPSSSLDDE
jgi:hypothetical protein